MVRIEAVEGEVVDHAAVGVAHGGVLNLAVDQLRGVVDGHLLDEIESPGALDDDLAHVRDVEKAGGVAHGEMLVDHSAVLHGHLPAAEVDHPGAHLFVHIVQRGFFKHEFLLGMDGITEVDVYCKISGIRSSHPRVIR